MDNPTARDVLAGAATWAVEHADCVEFLGRLPDDSVDLLLTSPPYEKQRTYGLDTMVGGELWVEWMASVVRAAAPKVKGLIAINCEGQTRDYRYSCVPYLLVADLHRAGFNLRKPVAYHRVGIPGSGGPDWLRGDWEPVVCVTRPGRLPWSDNTACGHPPKWAPGGAMSHRLTDGTRTNQWGKTGAMTGTTATGNKEKPTIGKPRPSHVTATRGHTKRVPGPDGDVMREQTYTVPAKANPGTVFSDSLAPLDFAAALEEYGHVIGDGPDAVLRELRQAACSEAIPQWFQGVLARLGPPAVLRSFVQRHRPTGREPGQRGEGQGAEAGKGDQAPAGLRAVWADGPTGGSPPRREPDEQRPVESGGAVPVVPPAGAQERGVLGGRMFGLLQGSGLLQQALLQVQEVWRSARQVLRQESAEEGSDLIHCVVGGGKMGHPLAHLNEAPFPLTLAEFFVRSFCPPGGVIADCFAGSGTTGHAAVLHGRRFVGADVRECQAALARKRVASVAPSLFS